MFTVLWQALKEIFAQKPVTPVKLPMPANQNMTASPVAVAMIKAQESCRLNAYKDPRGVLTCGWGHTGGDVVWNTQWSQEHADAVLVSDIEIRAVKPLNRLLTVRLNHNQFDALVDFTYNCGEGNLAKSTLLQVINAGMFASVPLQLAQWNKIAGRVSSDLVRRREAEIALWLQ